MPEISVIIPVYNTEKYLERCIYSVLNQTSKKSEIILVNAGSTDNSEEIIQYFAKKYPDKINSITYKENIGVSKARNVGVEKAQGKYICFIDSDDYIEKNLFEKLEKFIQKEVDIIKYKLTRLDENQKEIEKINGPVFEEISGEQAFNMLCKEDVLLESPCLYMFNREFYIKNQFKFMENTYHEDFGLIPLIILKAKSVISTDIYGYCYIQSKNSITRNVDYNHTVKKAKDVLLHYDNMIEKIEIYSLNPKTKENIRAYYTNAILNKVKDLKPAEQNEYIQDIKKRRLIKNIKVHNIKQLIKKVILKIDIRLFSKMS